MNIVVIGLGSMGKRRIRLLKKIRPLDRIIGVDSNRERCTAISTEFGIDTVEDLAIALLQKPDYACVCTSPLSHAQIIHQCLQANASVFTEINLVSDLYDVNMALAKKLGKVLYLSSTPLFRAEVEYITKRVHQTEGNKGYLYHVGQYLPDWHPWESYKDFFIGSRRTNGCREILAIELPWLVQCFGEIEGVKALSNKCTGLDIDYHDNFSVLVQHKTGNQGVIVADVVCRKAIRYFEVYGERLYLTWDGNPKGLKEYDIENKSEHVVDLYTKTDHLEGYNPLIIENAYESELINFFEVTEHGAVPVYSFERDKDILKWIDKVESNV